MELVLYQFEKATLFTLQNNSLMLRKYIVTLSLSLALLTRWDYYRESHMKE